jgi:hypothetical protein
MKQYLHAFALLAVMASSHAVTAVTNWWNGETVFSGERRSELASRGYTFFAYYNAIMASNVSGGIHQDSDYAQDIYFGTELDLERLLGWKGTTFRLTGSDRAGDSIDGQIRAVLSVFTELGWLRDWNGKPGHFAVGVNSVSFHMPEYTSDETTDAFFRYYLQADQQVYQVSPGSGRAWCCS